MHMAPSGNVGIGTLTADYRLEVGSSGDGFRVGSANSWFEMTTSNRSRLGVGNGNGAEAGYIEGFENGLGENVLRIGSCADGGSCWTTMNFHENGRVGIGTHDWAPTEKLEVAGNICVEDGDDGVFIGDTGDLGHGMSIRRTLVSMYPFRNGEVAYDGVVVLRTTQYQRHPG